MLRFLTAGESHGPGLSAIVEGVPAGLPLTAEMIDVDLARRQKGYGRGGRMSIESDRVSIVAGTRFGYTLGSPIALQIENRDWKNWTDRMAVDTDPAGQYPEPEGRWEGLVTKPRPGHADLTGVMKYSHPDVRNVLERASARETAARVAVGAIAKALLVAADIQVFSQVLSIAGVSVAQAVGLDQLDAVEASPVRCGDPEAESAMIRRLDELKSQGDSAGGRFRVDAVGVPPGLGSYVHWDRRIDARLAGALMSIPAIKGVEIGDAMMAADLPGSMVHDELEVPDWSHTQGRDPSQGFLRRTNRAGGIEGGMSNGETVWLVAAMKPIPTLYKPLRSFDIRTKEPFQASVERSDTCAVPAAAVVGEAMVAWVLAEFLLEKFGGDSASEMTRNISGYRAEVEARLGW